ncbi:MAG: hypothetical protein IJ706_00020 [Clostridia bacterium]|nr:hypothetical protein [Clostridia bacterium]
MMVKQNKVKSIIVISLLLMLFVCFGFSVKHYNGAYAETNNTPNINGNNELPLVPIINNPGFADYKIMPTEIKAKTDSFDDSGIYTSNYEINITFSSAFSSNSDGNLNPENISPIADELLIGEKTLTEWWTLFSKNQNNFTVQKWGNRLRLVFNQGLMHNTLHNTSLDSTFYIELRQNVITSLGKFRTFKYEIKPVKNDNAWSIEITQVHSTADLENAKRVNATLNDIRLDLCYSAADHNLKLTFSDKVFNHDGTVASGEQIGVLKDIRVNDVSLCDWYNYNTSGKLDTVIFYPQSGCSALTMQFKIDRMTSIFEKDPIYFEDIVVESGELEWEYYDNDDILNIVTIPAFSYTYSQNFGAFYKTGEVPEISVEPLRVKDISPISTFKEDNTSGQNPGTQVFSIVFWSDFCGPNSIKFIPDYEELLDKVLLNGISLRELKNTAVDKNGEKLDNAVTVQMVGYMGESDKRIVIYLDGKLDERFLFKKVATDRIELKAGLTSKLGQVLNEDVVFEYFNNSWRKVIDTSNLQYTDLIVTSISKLRNVTGAEVINGRRAVTFFMYFDRPVSYERLLYVSRNKENLLALKKSGVLKVSEEKIYGIVDNRIGDYILDYIKYDGKTLRETLQAESTVAMQTWGIDVHYTGDTFYTNAIQFTFNPEVSCFPDDGKSHTIEIIEGFVSPLLGKTSKSITFELLPETLGWKDITDSNSGSGYPDLPPSNYAEKEQIEQGCSSSFEITGDVLPMVITLSVVSLFVLWRKKKNEDIG